MPVSATLGSLAYLLALVVGITAGTIAALRQNSRVDYASMAVAMLGISMPNFVLGPTLVFIFALSWYWLPPARWEGFGSHMVLPVLTLSAVYMAYIARLTRSGMLEVLRSNYIRTARAKGLSERDVIIRHAVRGGLLPVVSFSGPALAFLISGTVVVERIFALPGLGNYFINANLNRDEPLIIGIVAFMSMPFWSSTCWSTWPTPSSIRASATDHGRVDDDPGKRTGRSWWSARRSGRTPTGG